MTSPRPRKLDPVFKKRARNLRKDSPGPERALWRLLRNRQLDGLKFRRQQVIDHFIVDFYCDEHKLVVEVDGESHVGRGDEDARRTQSLEQHGVRVIRFTNDEVLHDLEPVALAILRACGRDPEAPRS